MSRIFTIKCLLNIIKYIIFQPHADANQFISVRLWQLIKNTEQTT